MATPAVDVNILDGTAKTFQNYSDLLFIPYVKSHLETADIVDRVDIVWDVYIPDSLKTETRQYFSASYRGKSQTSSLLIKQSSLHVARKSSLDW